MATITYSHGFARFRAKRDCAFNGGAMSLRVLIAVLSILSVHAVVLADTVKTASAGSPAASRQKLGSSLDASTITEQDVTLPVIGIEIEQDPKASDDEQAAQFNEYLFVLAGYVDLKKLTTKGAPFVVSAQLVSGDATATGYWAVAELVTGKSPPQIKVIAPFVIRTLPKYRVFSAVCKGPVDEINACIDLAARELTKNGEEPASTPRVEIVSEGDVPEHAETRITLPVRPKAGASGAPSNADGPSKGNPPAQATPLPHSEKAK